MGQTVNLLSFDFGGSNPSYPTWYARGYRFNCCIITSGSSSIGRALAFQARGCGFETRLPLRIEGWKGREIPPDCGDKEKRSLCITISNPLDVPKMRDFSHVKTVSSLNADVERGEKLAVVAQW